MTDAARTSLQLNPWLTRPVQIAEIIHEATGISTYRLTTVGQAEDHDYRFIPGQFNMLYLPGVGEAAISMSGDPLSPDSWIHTVRVAGNVTRTLAGLKPGDTLGVRGPFGSGWPIDELPGRDVIVVAGGLGLAPLRPLIYHLIHGRLQLGKVWLICGARTPDGLLYRSEFDSWRQHGIDIQLTVDRATPDWKESIGVVTLLIDRLQLTDPDKVQMVACGPEVMMKYAAASGLRLGLRPEQIWLSMERNMQCAAGLCGHCQLGPDFICKDGPVLRYDRLCPFLFVEQL